MKTCRYCGEGGPTKSFKKNGCSKDGVDNVHKKCHSKYVYSRILEKKLKLYPKLYSQCDNDDCMHIYRKAISKKCPRCGSEEAI